MRYDGELYLLSHGGPTRDPHHGGLVTLYAISRALDTIPPRARKQLPNCEFIAFLHDHTAMYGHDKDPSPVSCAYTKQDTDICKNVGLMPEFGFFGRAEAMIGSWTQARCSIMDVENCIPSLEDKVSQIYWRGSPVFNRHLRDFFVEVTTNQTLADVATFGQFNK